MKASFRRGCVILMCITVFVLMLPLIFCQLPRQELWGPELDHWESRLFYNEYALVRPYQLFANVTGRYFLEMENMTTYDCPRVYWPTCGWDDVTYVNACILHALNRTKMKRFGPCLTYRRRTTASNIIVIPAQWRTNKTESEKIRKNFKLTEKDFHKLFGFAIS